MSNTSRILTVEILNEAAIRAAVAQLIKDGRAISIEENAIPRMFYQGQFVNAQRQAGKSLTADLVIRSRDTNYDLGLVKEDKRFIPVFDSHGGFIANTFGNGQPIDYRIPEAERQKHHIKGFLLEYSVQNTLLTARSRGQMCQRVTNPATGRPRVKISIPV